MQGRAMVFILAASPMTQAFRPFCLLFPDDRPATIAPAMTANDTTPVTLTCGRALLRGTVGFTTVSVAGFAIWAFGGRWFYAHVGEAGLYAACSIVFLGLSGLLLHPLISGPRPLLRFYKVFIPAFVAYAIVWCAFWFALHFGAGEWLGSFFGCAAFALVLSRAFGNYRALPKVIALLFITHSAGYFAGGFAMEYLMKSGNAEWLNLSKRGVGVLAKLMWGVCFGAGFGFGIGYAFFAMQKEPSRRMPARRR